MSGACVGDTSPLPALLKFCLSATFYCEASAGIPAYAFMV